MSQEIRFEVDGETVTGGKPGEVWHAVYTVPDGLDVAGMTESQAEEYDVSPRFEREPRTLTDEEKAMLRDVARQEAQSWKRPASKPRLLINAGELRDLWRHLTDEIPFPMTLSDGTEIEVVAGDPQSGEVGREFADLDEVYVQSTGL